MKTINITIKETGKKISLLYDKEKNIFQFQYENFLSQNPVHYKNDKYKMFLSIKKDYVTASFLNDISLIDYISIDNDQKITEIRLNSYFLRKISATIKDQKTFIEQFTDMNQLLTYFDSEVEMVLLQYDYLERLNMSEAITEIKSFLKFYNSNNLLKEYNFEKIKKVVLEKEKRDVYLLLKDLK